jgi:hypothetical protein
MTLVKVVDRSESSYQRFQVRPRGVGLVPGWSEVEPTLLVVDSTSGAALISQTQCIERPLLKVMKIPQQVILTGSSNRGSLDSDRRGLAAMDVLLAAHTILT